MPIDASADSPAAPAPSAPPADACPFCGFRRISTPCPACADTVLFAPGGDLLRQPPRRGFFAVDLLRGARAFFEGITVLFNRPEFAGKLKLPVIANLVVATGLAIALWFGFHALFINIAGSTDLFGWFGGILALLLTLISLAIVLPPVVELVLGPFLEPLADVIEKAMGGPGMAPVQRHLWTNVTASAQSAAELFMIAGGAWLATLVLGLIGLAPLGFLVAAAIQALTWFELPLFRRGYGMRARIALLRHNWALAIGFGLGAQLGMAIPVFNVLLFSPAAAVGATMLFLRMDKRALTAPAAAPAQRRLDRGHPPTGRRILRRAPRGQRRATARQTTRRGR